MWGRSLRSHLDQTAATMCALWYILLRDLAVSRHSHSPRQLICNKQKWNQRPWTPCQACPRCPRVWAGSSPSLAAGRVEAPSGTVLQWSPTQNGTAPPSGQTPALNPAWTHAPSPHVLITQVWVTGQVHLSLTMPTDQCKGSLLAPRHAATPPLPVTKVAAAGLRQEAARLTVPEAALQCLAP